MNSCVEAPPNVSLWNMQYPTPGMQFHNAHSQKDAAQQQISVKLAQTVCAFTSALSSTGTGTLSQIWLPSVSEDGSVVLSTQVIRPKPRYCSSWSRQYMFSATSFGTACLSAVGAQRGITLGMEP